MEQYLSSVRQDEEACSKMADVRGRKSALNKVWATTLDALMFAREAYGMLTPALEGSGQEEGGAGGGGGSGLDEFEVVAGLMQQDASKSRVHVSLARHRCEERESSVATCNAAGEKQVADLKEKVKSYEDDAIGARHELEAAVDTLVRELAPRLPALAAIHTRYLHSSSAATALRMSLASAEQQWLLQSQHLADCQVRIATSHKASDEQHNVISNFEQGCNAMLEQMQRIARERCHAQSSEQHGWHVALAELHDKAWISMQETFIKNKTLMEEWEEEKEGILDGVHTALERLDPIEECKLQTQLQAVEARLRDTTSDNQQLADLIYKVEKAFQPVLEALSNGSLGKPLTTEDKLKHGLTAEDWAYWLGGGGGRGGGGARGGVWGCVGGRGRGGGGGGGGGTRGERLVKETSRQRSETRCGGLRTAPTAAPARAVAQES